jgi:hypothetical protein
MRSHEWIDLAGHRRRLSLGGEAFRESGRYEVIGPDGKWQAAVIPDLAYLELLRLAAENTRLMEEGWFSPALVVATIRGRERRRTLEEVLEGLRSENEQLRAIMASVEQLLRDHDGGAS